MVSGIYFKLIKISCLVFHIGSLYRLARGRLRWTEHSFLSTCGINFLTESTVVCLKRLHVFQISQNSTPLKFQLSVKLLYLFMIQSWLVEAVKLYELPSFILTAKDGLPQLQGTILNDCRLGKFNYRTIPLLGLQRSLHKNVSGVYKVKKKILQLLHGRKLFHSILHVTTPVCACVLWIHISYLNKLYSTVFCMTLSILSVRHYYFTSLHVGFMVHGGISPMAAAHYFSTV
jgi:hypothetical protein